MSGSGAQGNHSSSSAPSADSILTLLAGQQAQLLEDRRKDRFWRNIRALGLMVTFLAGPVVIALMSFTAGSWGGLKDYAALVHVDGEIGADQPANAASVIKALEKAFEDRHAKGVIVDINSPGGSPVQASMIRDRLVQLRQEYPSTTVWAVGEDLLTSGAYFIAVGAPNICVNRSSVAGSIGVIASGWGFDKFIDRFGIERRVFTAGLSKDRNDPFRPLSTTDEQKTQQLLAAVHQHFIDTVKAGRGGRLKGSDEELFNGDYWTGQEALRKGLVDKLCDLSDVVHRDLQAQTVRDYSTPPSLMEAIAGRMSHVLTDWTGHTEATPQLLPTTW